jgi:ribose/xylose/arabinose/galactoside ABC-type transport system permease subunit
MTAGEAPTTEESGLVRRIAKRASLFNLAGLFIAWALVFAFFTWQIGLSFGGRANVETLFRQTTIVGLASLGATFIIVSGGIDLSVGSVVAFVTVVIARVVQAGHSPWVALAAGVAAGALAGLLNGVLITRLKVGAFIVTLGTLGLFRGIATGLANEQKIDAPETWLNEILATLGKSERWRLLPYGVWFTLGLAFLMSWILRRTVFGRHVVAVGSNEHAARLCGVPIDRVKLLVYVIGGITVGLAGLMQFSRLTVGDPTVARGLELDVIAAVVIGGASLSGGQGSIAGTLLGALLLSTIRSGASQMGLPNWVQDIVTGAIIVLSVTLDRFRTRQS